ncbi:MAG: site-2 protease family protein [Candidatus Limnocylindrales bacterium]|nr:site-2 protease family protein [Candidatus Limnocylindrales bacterium]
MSSIPLLRLFGFEIRVHVSWAVIMAVIAVTAEGQIGRVEPGMGVAVRWAVAAVVAASLLVSAVLHELGHAYVARRAGVSDGPVVVYFFGAAATTTLTTRRPRDEVVVAVAGSMVSFALGAVLVLAGLAAGRAGPTAVQGAGEVAVVVGTLNLLLGGFNLLPAFPLDGGRVVRGIAWHRSGDPDLGLRAAARVGRRFGLGLAALGFIVIVAADSLDGLMIALCGWFLVSTSGAALRQAQFDAVVGDLRVGDVMDRMVQGVPPGLTIDTFAARVLDGSASPSLPVVRGPHLLGVIGQAQLRRIRPNRWATTRAEDLMVAAPGLPVIDSATPIRAVLEQLQRHGLDGLPVVDAGTLAGVVTRQGVVEALRLRALAQRPAGGWR